MKYKKGSTIATLHNSFRIVPLFDLDVQTQHIHDLPHYQTVNIALLLRSIIRRDGVQSEKILSYIQTIIKSTESCDHCIASIVVALYIFIADNELEWMSCFGIETRKKFDEHNNDDDDENNCGPFTLILLKQSWKLVQTVLSFDFWKKFTLTVFRNIQFVVREHPLIAYSMKQIPNLSSKEIDVVLRSLKITSKTQSTIAIQKQIRDECIHGPKQIFAVIPFGSKHLVDCFDSAQEIDKYPHSCLPTAQYEINQDGLLIVTALYDIEFDDDISMCYICDGTVEQRDNTLNWYLGYSCSCLRCRYEISSMDEMTQQSVNTITMEEMVRLSHFYVAQGNLKTAKALYKQILSMNTSVTNERTFMLDVYHALGAIELSSGNFLEAQRVWNAALQDYPIECSCHEGLSLQFSKMKCYEYLDCQRGTSPPNVSFQWETIIPGCFVTPVLDDEICTMVIKMSEEYGVWTKQRHYEVPTYDIPVHSVPLLLDWFQNQFMKPIVQPLLAKQFQTKGEGNFYVHDAFCVRYESGLFSNHLPIHTDESTHSLVVSLNSDYDGGGTYLYDHDILIRPNQGSVLSFRGDSIPHGGEAVRRGIRYILAVFLYYDDGTTSTHSVGMGTKSMEPKRTATELGVNVLLKDAKKQRSSFTFDFDCGKSARP